MNGNELNIKRVIYIVYNDLTNQYSHGYMHVVVMVETKGKVEIL